MTAAAPLEAYPLTWPTLQPRTPASMRTRGRFQVSLATARDDLVRQLELLGSRSVVVSSGIPTRRDGLPYASAAAPKDPGVAVYFDRLVRGERHPFVIACDSDDRVEANLRAIGATVEALRTIQRHGASTMLEQAFTGFAALPPAPGDEPWWDVLGVTRNVAQVEALAAYRARARDAHPDQGGTTGAMTRLNAAWERARKDRGW